MSQIGFKKKYYGLWRFQYFPLISIFPICPFREKKQNQHPPQSALSSLGQHSPISRSFKVEQKKNVSSCLCCSCSWLLSTIRMFTALAPVAMCLKHRTKSWCIGVKEVDFGKSRGMEYQTESHHFFTWILAQVKIYDFHDSLQNMAISASGVFWTSKPMMSAHEVV